MYKGTYVAMTGAVLRRQELDTVAHNLANIGTTGFKKSSFSSRLYPLLEGAAANSPSLYPDARSMTYYGEAAIDTTEGNMKTTGNPLDLAVRGEGFLAVQAKGKTYYTRNGSLSLDKQGFLINEGGMNVLDTNNRPLRAEGETKITIHPDGSVYADAALVGKLKLTALANIQHVGGSLLSGDERGAAKGEVAQGSIEMSNVNPVQELIGIINALRGYETAQKVIQNFQDLSQRTVTDLARV